MALQSLNEAMTGQTSSGGKPITPDHRDFIAALRNVETPAIKQLHSELAVAIKSIKGIYLISKEDIEELKNDALLITIRRLQDGQILFDHTSPVAFARGVVIKLLQNRMRKRSLDVVELVDHGQSSGFDVEEYLLYKETELKIGKLLASLGGVCEKIIRLKYFDLMKDQDIVGLRLVPFSNVDSLKSKRCFCLKKLAELAKEQGINLKSVFLKQQ